MNLHMRTDEWRLGARVRARAAVLLMAVAMALVPVLARAQPAVVTVPWNGIESQSHQVYSGGQLVLQGVATDLSTGAALSVCSSTWDFGDLTATASGGTNGYALEATHTYSGSVGQPYTATLTVKLNPCATGGTLTDTFKVVIAPNNTDTKVNMARDKGLWNLHKRINRTTSDGLASGYWINGGSAGNFLGATTAGVVQAFEVNGHRESGDRSKDPYVDDVARGLRYALSTQADGGSGYLQRIGGTAGTIGNQTVPTGYTPTAPWATTLTSPQNPDSNGNGYGLYLSYGSHTSYINGQLMDALVASGTPDKTAETGQLTYVRGRAYKDIIQDMLDGYSWGMNDAQGGWNYNYNDGGGNDTSASHWWAIGTLASRVWGLDAPAWVRNLQWNVGVTLMQRPPSAGTRPGYLAGCYFGYSNSYDSWWGDNQMNVTAAGLILLNADNVPKDNARYTCAMQWLDNYFNNQLGNFYTMYQLAKAMRTATDSTGAAAPITLLNGTRDWYAAYANNLIANQQASGAFVPTAGSIGSYIQGDMASSWAILILSPALFVAPPNAVCSVDATTVCVANDPLAACNVAGANPYATVHFDGSQSTQGDNPIASYSWNFDDGGPTIDASTVTASTQYTTTGTKNVQLTVTDTKGNSSSVTCPVSVTASALPPTANAGGPYQMCLGSSLLLDGSGSTERGSHIVSYEWDFKGAINFAVIDATGVTSDQTAYFNSLSPGTYDVGLRIKDDSQPVNTITDFTKVTVADCTPPVITVPANISRVMPNSTVSFTVSATDNVDTTVPVTCTSSPAGYSSGSNFPVGTTTITCNATDQAGNHAAPKSFTVTVKNLATATANASGGTYNGNPYPGNGSCTPVSLTPVITYTPGPGAPVDAGTTGYTVTCGDGDVTYQTATATGTITITQAPVTATAGGGENVYDGATHAPSACVVTGVYKGDLTCTNNPATAGAGVGTTPTTPAVSGTGLGNYDITSVNGSYKITLAPSATVVTCTDAVYTGSPITTCTANVTGAGGLNAAVTPVTYSNNTDVGTAGASATYAGDSNHSGSSGSSTFAITLAPSATVVTCTPSVVYNGAAQTVCTANVTGVGGLNAAVTPVTYTNNTDVGTAGASATYAGDSNHSGSSGSSTFAITLAPSATVVTCTPSVVYNGAAQTVCTANVTGVGGLNAAVTPVTYTNNTNVGTAGASATYAGDANHSTSTGTGSFAITPAPSTTTVSAPTVTYSADGTVTVTVTSAAGTVVGSVTLTVDGGAPLTQVLSGGSTTFTLSKPNAGDHALAASFATQGNFAASSAAGNLHVNQSPTATTLTSTPSPQAAGQTVTLTATVVAVAPGSGVPNGSVTFTDGATTLGTAPVNASGVAVLTTTSLAVGPHSITAAYSGSSNYIPSAASAVSQLIYGYPAGGGTFVIGDQNAVMGGSVNFWGSQWEKTNSLSGGASNASFKGFAVAPSTPVVGGTFTAAPGNSAPSPASVPAYIGIIVTSKVTKSGSTITGTIVKLVVVRVDAGYAGDPGHAGTGTIVAVIQ